MTGAELAQIIILVIFIIMSAYFSRRKPLSHRLTKTRLKAMAESGNKRALFAFKVSEQYDKLLSTILIGNNIVNIAMASIGTVLFVRIFGGDIGATVSTAVITVTVLIFGEITPKSIAKECPEKFAMFSAPILKFFICIFTPLNFIFSKWKRLVSKALKLESDTRMSQEELLMLVEEVQQDGSIDKSEGELLRNAIEFTEREAEDILTHRVDLEAVSADSTKEEIARVFSETKFSRILVYNESIDDIIGVIHQKDFYVEGGISGLDIRELVTPVVFVVRNEKISTILHVLQTKKAHVAVVLDEYGGTYGIVTMEDILEELVGEIWDEHDEICEDFRKLGENVYRVNSSADINDFCRFFNVKLKTEMSSLGGWITERLEHIPENGDSFKYEKLLIKVAGMEHHRISEAEVRIEDFKEADSAE